MPRRRAPSCQEVRPPENAQRRCECENALDLVVVNRHEGRMRVKEVNADQKSRRAKCEQPFRWEKRDSEEREKSQGNPPASPGRTPPTAPHVSGDVRQAISQNPRKSSRLMGRLNATD